MAEEIKGNWLDKLIGFVSPVRGYQRACYRTAGQLMASYNSAFATRTTTPWSQSESLGGLPHLNLQVHRSLRDRCRSLVENNQLASSILYRAVENIVGSGFRYETCSADPDYNKRADELMHNWFGIADFYGRSWIQHQRLACNSLIRDGDMGGALLSKGQVQLVESDYISSPYTRANAFLHDGVEVDPYGRPAQYWVMQYVDLQKRDWRPVKPKDFLFVANTRRVNMYRGEPYFTQSLDLHDRLERMIRAVTLSMEIGACFTVFKMQNPTAMIGGLRLGKGAQNATMREAKIEPGMIQTLLPGEDIKQTDPVQPGGDFSANFRLFIRLLGLSVGMPLEYVLMDFSEVSGNTAKASQLAAQRAFEGIQRLLIDEYYTRLARWRLGKFVRQGLLEERADGFAHAWHADPWPYLDLVKELQGAQMEIDIGISSREALQLSRGVKPSVVNKQRAAELAADRLAGVPIYHATSLQEIGVKAPASTQESIGTPQVGEQPAEETVPGDEQRGGSASGGGK